MVDTLGLPIALQVVSASTQEGAGGPPVIAEAKVHSHRLLRVWADGGYAGRCVQVVRELTGVTLEVVLRPGSRDKRRWIPEGAVPPPIPSGFRPLPHRWIVERTFAWVGRYRRLVRDHEETVTSSRALILIGFIRLLVQRFGEFGA